MACHDASDAESALAAAGPCPGPNLKYGHWQVQLPSHSRAHARAAFASETQSRTIGSINHPLAVRFHMELA
jgi:hypothetical protein